MARGKGASDQRLLTPLPGRSPETAGDPRRSPEIAGDPRRSPDEFQKRRSCHYTRDLRARDLPPHLKIRHTCFKHTRFIRVLGIRVLSIRVLSRRVLGIWVPSICVLGIRVLKTSGVMTILNIIPNKTKNINAEGPIGTTRVY